MNILISSAGRRVKLVNYFSEELDELGGNIVAIDCDQMAPAMHFADFCEVVPRIEDSEYVQTLKRVCKKYEIDAMLSLIDPELSLLAKHKDEFEKENIRVIVSDYDVVSICFDKYLTYTFLQENDIPVVPTYIEINEVIVALENGQIHFPFIVKPRKGSASIGIKKINSLRELYVLFEEYDDLIVQPFIEGDEFGVDCYIDLINNQVTNIFSKKKIKMRAGETDKSIAIKDPGLNLLIEKLINVLKPLGPIDIDCFKTESGYIISEINPRFGGGYPHAYEMGQNFVKNIINNLQGRANESQVGNYDEGSILVKFDNHQIINRKE